MSRDLPLWTRWTYAVGALLLVGAAGLVLTGRDPAAQLVSLQAEARELSARVASADATCESNSSALAGAGPTTAASGLAATPYGLSSPSTPPLGRAMLARKLEAATAMVIVKGGQGLQTGTGFFVTNELLVTNRHVVEQSTGRYVLVVSQSLGSARRAQVLGLTPGTEAGSPDFALLKLADGSAPGRLSLSQDVQKLDEVVAAGYPGMVVASDSSFERLTHGDLSAAPDLNLTQGVVQSLQRDASGTGLVVHTAPIAKGNSGGPLVDACGRVVGVNTFVNVDQTQSAKIGYAIDVSALQRFVQGLGAGSVGADTTICRTASGR